MESHRMKVLVIDVGGTHVKLIATGRKASVTFPSGPNMTPRKLVAGVRAATLGWTFQAVSIGYPGPVIHGHPLHDPSHLGPGWVGFNFKKAFGRPVKMINDAAMQALGSYQGGRMLFLGLGTGLGSAVIVDGILEPMELAHLPYKKGRCFEEYVGIERIEAARQEEMAQMRGRRRQATQGRGAGGIRRAWRRQCTGAKKAPARESPGKQSECLSGRVPTLGEAVHSGFPETFCPLIPRRLKEILVHLRSSDWNVFSEKPLNFEVVPDSWTSPLSTGSEGLDGQVPGLYGAKRGSAGAPGAAPERRLNGSCRGARSTPP